MQHWTRNQLIERAVEMIGKGTTALEVAISLPEDEPKTASTNSKPGPKGKFLTVIEGGGAKKPHWTQTAAGKAKMRKAMRKHWKTRKTA